MLKTQYPTYFSNDTYGICTSGSSDYGNYKEVTSPATPPMPEKKSVQQKKDQSSHLTDQINYLALTGEKRYIVKGDELTEITGGSTKLHAKELDLTIMTPKQATSQYEWIKKRNVTCDSLFAQDVPSDFLVKTIPLLKPKKLEIRGRSQSKYTLAADFLKHEFIKEIDEIKIMADSSLNLNCFETRKGGGQTIWLDMDAAASAEELDQFRKRAKAMEFDLISLNFRKSKETIFSNNYLDPSGHEILIKQGPTRFTLQKEIQSKRDSSSGSPKTKRQKSKK